MVLFSGAARRAACQRDSVRNTSAPNVGRRSSLSKAYARLDNGLRDVVCEGTESAPVTRQGCGVVPGWNSSPKSRRALTPPPAPRQATTPPRSARCRSPELAGPSAVVQAQWPPPVAAAASAAAAAAAAFVEDKQDSPFSLTAPCYESPPTPPALTLGELSTSTASLDASSTMSGLRRSSSIADGIAQTKRCLAPQTLFKNEEGLDDENLAHCSSEPNARPSQEPCAGVSSRSAAKSPDCPRPVVAPANVTPRGKVTPRSSLTSRGGCVRGVTPPPEIRRMSPQYRTPPRGRETPRSMAQSKGSPEVFSAAQFSPGARGSPVDDEAPKVIFQRRGPTEPPLLSPLLPARSGMKAEAKSRTRRKQDCGSDVSLPGGATPRSESEQRAGTGAGSADAGHSQRAKHSSRRLPRGLIFVDERSGQSRTSVQSSRLPAESEDKADEEDDLLTGCKDVDGNRRERKRSAEEEAEEEAEHEYGKKEADDEESTPRRSRPDSSSVRFCLHGLLDDDSTRLLSPLQIVSIETVDESSSSRAVGAVSGRESLSGGRQGVLGQPSSLTRSPGGCARAISLTSAAAAQTTSPGDIHGGTRGGVRRQAEDGPELPSRSSVSFGGSGSRASPTALSSGSPLGQRVPTLRRQSSAAGNFSCSHAAECSVSGDSPTGNGSTATSSRRANSPGVSSGGVAASSSACSVASREEAARRSRQQQHQPLQRSVEESGGVARSQGGMQPPRRSVGSERRQRNG